MERATGIGGCFVRAADPDRLMSWYRDALGLALDEHGSWEPEPGPTVLAAFARTTDYLGADQQTMLNFRVPDLDAMLAQLRAAGTPAVGEVQQVTGIGRFAWVLDPEGNRVELWERA
jgi:predicted enzyme related to lactoylglutathione lyase